MRSSLKNELRSSWTDSSQLEYDRERERERESEVGQKVYEQILSIVAVVVLVVVLRANVWKKKIHSCTDVY